MAVHCSRWLEDKSRVARYRPGFPPVLRRRIVVVNIDPPAFPALPHVSEEVRRQLLDVAEEYERLARNASERSSSGS
jgi:hypothetical protein